jgi:hypothetical protein
MPHLLQLGFRQILADYPEATDGIYWIDTDGDEDSTDAYEVYCDMSGGGWTHQSDGSSWSLGYTGDVQSITTADIDAEYSFTVYGAAGGTGGGVDSDGGYGGRAGGTRTFSAGTTLYVYVGGQGEAGGPADSGTCDRAGGYNGGGASSRGGSGGGGGTDIRLVSGDLSSRILVGGGDRHQCNDEGGGGGGWYGGGAGGGANFPAGGGSSYYDGMDGSTSTETGVNSGHGYVEYVFR